MRDYVQSGISFHTHPRTRLLVVVSVVLVATGIWNMDGALGAMGISGWALCAAAWGLGRANLRHIGITIDAPHRATAGIAYPMQITVVKNRGWLDTRRLSTHVLLPGNASAEFEFHLIGVGMGVDATGHATPVSRADGKSIVISSHSNFPLGLFEFSFDIRVRHPICVIPRSRTPRQSLEDGVMLDTSPMAGATQGWFDGELRGLRGWRGGDRPGQVAWPASLRAIARGTGPLVRETDPPGFLPDRCLILFHSFSSSGSLIHPEKFERALEVTTGWIENLSRFGIGTRLSADFDAWKPRPANTRDEIIILRERFARAKRKTSTEAHELQRAITHHANNGEVVILVSDMPPEAWMHDIQTPERMPVISTLQAR
jgi:hypothetical protein